MAGPCSHHGLLVLVGLVEKRLLGVDPRGILMVSRLLVCSSVHVRRNRTGVAKLSVVVGRSVALGADVEVVDGATIAEVDVGGAAVVAGALVVVGTFRLILI